MALRTNDQNVFTPNFVFNEIVLKAILCNFLLLKDELYIHVVEKFISAI